ncbi:MAG: hypothetical protein AB1297_09450, partial [bacterium]
MIFVLCLGIYGIRRVLFSSLFTIKNVEVKVSGDISENEIMRLWKGFLRQNYPGIAPNLFKLKKDGLHRYILSDVRVKRVEIKRYPPHRIVIFIEPRRAFVWIKDGLGVDEEGVIFPIKGTQSLAYLSGFEGKKMKEVINVSSLFSLLKGAKNYSFFTKIKEIRLEKNKAFFSLNSLWVSIPLEMENSTKRFKRLEIIL